MLFIIKKLKIEKFNWLLAVYCLLLAIIYFRVKKLV